MALLRQCLQELRVRRGETDLFLEGPQARVAMNRAIDTRGALTATQRRPLITPFKQPGSDRSVPA